MYMLYKTVVFVYVMQFSEAVEDRIVKHAVGDILYHIDKEGQHPEF